MKPRRYWIGTVSQEHVEHGKAGGFAQLCHGKITPLKRMQPGDVLIYYSPQIQFKTKAPYQCFTALGIIKDSQPYQFEMNPDFIPYRRDILYLPTADAPIRPLIIKLNFIKNKNSWGYVFRFGMIEISSDDFQSIATAMQLERDKIDELLI